MNKKRKDLPIIDINKKPKEHDEHNNKNEYYEDETYYEINRSRNRKILYFISPWLFIFFLILIVNIYMKSNNFDDIEKYADYYGVDKELLSGIMYVENKFEVNYDVESRVLSIIYPTSEQREIVSDDLAKYYKDDMYSDLDTEEVNAVVNAWYLKHLLEVFNGNEQNAICAFDVGEETVNQWLKDPDITPNGVDMLKIPNEETRLYIKDVNMARSVFGSFYKLEF